MKVDDVNKDLFIAAHPDDIVITVPEGARPLTKLGSVGKPSSRAQA
jgi:hypothetical protein